MDPNRIDRGFLTSTEGLSGVVAGDSWGSGRGRGLSERRSSRQSQSPLPREPAVPDRASLDVSASVLKSVTGWIARHRRRLDLRTLAGQAGLSIATAYRYLHEALEVIAAHAPDLEDVLAHARATGLPFLCLDGTLVRTDRVAVRAERGHHLWYSGK